jgi:superfamily I DNA/RNA helicase
MVRLDELKAQNPIVDVVERYGVALQPSGKNRRYRQILAKARKWDLGELIPAALEALRLDEVLASLFRQLCQHVMVDEWQDVSLLEYTFLKELLEGDNLFVRSFWPLRQET